MPLCRVNILRRFLARSSVASISLGCLGFSRHSLLHVHFHLDGDRLSMFLHRLLLIFFIEEIFVNRVWYTIFSCIYLVGAFFINFVLHDRICVALIVCTCSACASYGEMATCFCCEVSELGLRVSNFRTIAMADL